MKILIIDDSMSFINYFQHAVRSFNTGIKIDGATYFDDGLKRIKENAYDLILIDELMPEISGHEVREKIKSIDNGKIFLISNMDRESINQAEFELGNFISKSDLMSASQIKEFIDRAI